MAATLTVIKLIKEAQSSEPLIFDDASHEYLHNSATVILKSQSEDDLSDLCWILQLFSELETERGVQNG